MTLSPERHVPRRWRSPAHRENAALALWPGLAVLLLRWQARGRALAHARMGAVPRHAAASPPGRDPGRAVCHRAIRRRPQPAHTGHWLVGPRPAAVQEPGRALCLAGTVPWVPWHLRRAAVAQVGPGQSH